MTLIKLLMAAGILTSLTVRADSGYFIVPSLSITQLHDDNLFFSASSQESSYITRVSPALELGYESARLSWSGRARVDAEEYRGHSELNSNATRQFGDVAVEYIAGSRLTLAMNADYTKTNTPVDLALIPGSANQGPLIDRAEAERVSIHPAIHYRFTPTVSGSLDYTRTHDELFGVAESDTDVAEIEIAQGLSQATTVSYGYIYRRYQFEVAPIDTVTDPSVASFLLSFLDGGSQSSSTSTGFSSSEDTHTPWLGLSHEINTSTVIVGRAGSRISNDSRDRYLLFGFLKRYPTGQILLEYERNEAVLLGGGGRQEYETASITMSKQIGLKLNVKVVPAYAKISQQDSSPEIYSLALESEYKINKAVSLTAGYGFNYQQVSFSGGPEDEVTRNVISLGITLTYPGFARQAEKTSNHSYDQRLQKLGIPEEEQR